MSNFRRKESNIKKVVLILRFTGANPIKVILSLDNINLKLIESAVIQLRLNFSIEVIVKWWSNASK